MGFFRSIGNLLLHTSALPSFLGISPWKAFLHAVLLIFLSSFLATCAATCRESGTIQNVSQRLAERTGGLYEKDGFTLLGNKEKESHLTFDIGDLPARFDYARSDDFLNTMPEERFAKQKFGLMLTESQAVFWTRSQDDIFQCMNFPLQDAFPQAVGTRGNFSLDRVQVKTFNARDMVLSMQNVTGIPVVIRQNEDVVPADAQWMTAAYAKTVLYALFGEVIFFNFFFTLLLFLFLSSLLFAIIEQFRLRTVGCPAPFRNAVTLTVYTMFPAFLVVPLFCAIFPDVMDFSFLFFVVFAVYHVFSIRHVYIFFMNVRHATPPGACQVVDEPSEKNDKADKNHKTTPPASANPPHKPDNSDNSDNSDDPQ